jgi:hypothetical protein
MGGAVGRREAEGRSLLGNLLMVLGTLTVLLLTSLGLLTVVVEVLAWSAGERWQPPDIAALQSMVPSRPILRAVEFSVQYGTYIAGIVVAFFALMKIDKIGRLIREFNDGNTRSTISGLVDSAYRIDHGVTQLAPTVEGLVPAIERAAAVAPALEHATNRLEAMLQEASSIAPALQATTDKLEDLLTERLETILTQIARLERLTVSEQLESNDGTTSHSMHDDDPLLLPEPANQSIQLDSGESSNWEKIREFWNENGERIDRARESIKGKAMRKRISAMPRTNYPAIIEELAKYGIIGEVAREKSLNLHKMFMQHRRRKHAVPDAIVGDMDVLNQMLRKLFDSSEVSQVDLKQLLEESSRQATLPLVLDPGPVTGNPDSDRG